MFHVLRHTYASVQLEAGESIVRVSSWLAHSSPNITLAHYTHFMPGAGQRSLAVMDTWLASDQQRKVPAKSLVPSWPGPKSLKPQATAITWGAADVKVKYKETARSDLAVNIIEC